MWYAEEPLLTKPHPTEEHKVVVVGDWSFWSERLGCKVTVPDGFVFDWDSVPRLPVVYLLFKGRMKEESCAHDWLLKAGEACGEKITRRTADKVMKDGMVAKDRGAFWTFGAYVGVRLGSWGAWRKYRRAEKE
jgi:hypothetical protein